MCSVPFLLGSSSCPCYAGQQEHGNEKKHVHISNSASTGFGAHSAPYGHELLKGDGEVKVEYAVRTMNS